MPLLDKIGQFFNFGKRDNMAEHQEFVPTHILKHRYPDPRVLINYVKTLSDDFTDNTVQVKALKDGRLGLRVPRNLNNEEIQGALEAFDKAERERSNDNRD